ncbi:hypothetical protein IJG22_02545 [Candidatus Saccharibacteria bacterium]|nr:hypothetical protein [Candidatus Saccharibacteria bacterium]
MTEKSKSGAGKFFLGAALGAIAGAIAGKFVSAKVENDDEDHLGEECNGGFDEKDRCCKECVCGKEKKAEEKPVEKKAEKKVEKPAEKITKKAEEKSAEKKGEK